MERRRRRRSARVKIKCGSISHLIWLSI